MDEKKCINFTDYSKNVVEDRDTLSDKITNSIIFSTHVAVIIGCYIGFNKILSNYIFDDTIPVKIAKWSLSWFLTCKTTRVLPFDHTCLKILEKRIKNNENTED